MRAALITGITGQYGPHLAATRFCGHPYSQKNELGTQNIGVSTIIHGLFGDIDSKDRVTVPIYTLDSYIEREQNERVSAIKIDVEGYEFPVLNGLRNF